MTRIVWILLLSSHSLAADARWTVVWQDEFDGPRLDMSKWSFATGGDGWGNNELESYTSSGANAYVENGMLVIKAVKERYTGADHITRLYTSARLQTREKFSQTYGRFEARIKIPSGPGLWPAFWMLGNDFGSAGWPKCGELDIMENIGREPSVVHGTIHGPGYFGDRGLTGQYVLPEGRRLSDDFHVFSVEWEPDLIRWYIDSRLFNTVSRVNVPPGGRWVFDHPFFLLLNVAVGGNWPGAPDDSTVFPQYMFVDYVRVYQQK